MFSEALGTFAIDSDLRNTTNIVMGPFTVTASCHFLLQQVWNT